MTVTQQKTISLRNAYLVREALRYYDPGWDEYLPWVGRTDITVRLSTYASGYDASGYPSTLVGDYTMAEAVGAPGTYEYTIPADVLAVALAALVGQVIYQIVEGAYGSTYFDLSVSQPLVVTDPRVPQPGLPA